MPIRIETNGEEFNRYLESLKGEMLEQIRLVMEAVAFQIKAEAETNAPADNSDLARGFYIRDVEGDYLAQDIGNNVPYAPYVEFGTRFGTLIIPEELKELAAQYKVENPKKFTNQDAQPYLYPALIEGRKFMQQQLKDGFGQWLKQNGKK